MGTNMAAPGHCRRRVAELTTAADVERQGRQTLTLQGKVSSQSAASAAQRWPIRVGASVEDAIR